MILQGETMIRAITAALLLSLSMTALAQPSPEQIAEYRAAAAKGEAWGQYNLGRMYAKGKGVPEDDATAVKWYTKAAEQGNTYAENSVGDAYYHGRGVPQDYTTAVKWYTKSLEKNLGYILAPYTELRLGDIYSKGLMAGL